MSQAHGYLPERYTGEEPRCSLSSGGSGEQRRPAPDKRSRSKNFSSPIAKLTAAARKELAPKDEPAFFSCWASGCVRMEIDRLEWDAFRWAENLIRIQPTEFFDVKSEHSIGDVPVDPELMSLFRGYAARASSNFVIEGRELARKRLTIESYRAQAALERLSAWLRAHGVTARKPIHDLRKESDSHRTWWH